MGRGAAKSTDHQEVPRLTSVLRALVNPSDASFDSDEQYVQRKQILERRRKHSTNARHVVPGSSKLAQQILGSWDKAPKAAKEDFEKYLRAVRLLLGDESAGEAVHDAAVVALDVLRANPVPEPTRVRPLSYVIKPFREALASALGVLEESAVAEVASTGKRALEWQQQIGSRDDSQPSTSGRDHAEFGSDLELHIPSTRRSPLDIVKQLCGAPSVTGASSSREAPMGARAMAAMAAAVAADPSPEDLKAMYEAEGGGGAGGWGGYEDESDDEDGGKKGKVKADLRWLHRWCRGVAGVEGADDLALAVSRVLLTASGGEAAAAELYELLGDGALERITVLSEQRKVLADAIREALRKVREEDADMDLDAPAMPIYGTGVTITSSSQKLMAKLERKDRKRAKGKAGANAGDQELELLQAVGFEALMETEMVKDTRNGSLIFDGGLEFKLGDGGPNIWTHGVLPTGTTRKSYKGYEEVKVPAPTSLPPPTENELVKISELEEWAQLAFKGYKTLNRIQSRIFKAAYNSNENILVCAPTGAGKTNIAMITVLREVGQHMEHGVIQKNDFKIVYVAPMKALAAEVTASFSKRLEPLGLSVRELTGDMQLSKKELGETQMIVTTPEKWDVITRKGGDVATASLVKLLILDEVHLLNDDRGPVIEALVARTLRQVEASQSMIRIVGLSATLPNHLDVGSFLRAEVFHFDASFRPVPLETSFVGVSERNMMARNMLMNEICYDKVVDSLKRGYQCMVFVHSRKDTGKTARTLAELAGKKGEGNLFQGDPDHSQRGLYMKEVRKSRNVEVGELFDSGLGIHHAGMLRPDRTLTERLFSEGLIKVLVCTATLAWGVNLPAHTVIIKGTQVYDAQKGNFTDLGMLDVQQIFGRAGRPQFDTSGEATIITTHDKLAHYLGMLTHAIPIESQFKRLLVDNLNAEIVLGTVTNLREATQWLSYTYLYTRMTKNPLPYAITYQQLAMDPTLESHKKELVTEAAKELRNSKMAVFDDKSGTLYVTELGRVASHFYIRHNSMVIFNETLRTHMTEAEVLTMIAQSSEFDNMMVREEELPELETLLRKQCQYEVKGGAENKHGKINILMQAFVARARMDSFSLTADMMYISSNTPRIMRAIFEICLRRKWASMADTALTLCKALERRLWPEQHPLRQFEGILTYELLNKMEEMGLTLERLWDMEASEIGNILRHPAAGHTVKGCLDSFPSLSLEAALQPITRTVLRIQLTIRPTFTWKDRVHGGSMRWFIWVEDTNNEHIYHTELWTLTKKMAQEPEHKLAFTIPIFEPLPPQYYIRAISESWLQAEALLTVSFQSLILPERMPPHTDLLDLHPLPVSALGNPTYESMYTRFTHFNPIQTQAFHTLYHTDENVLLGAPTGSGKTISAELTMLRVFTHYPGQKVIYIAPLKALVRERMEDWGKGLCKKLNKTVVELTGDYTPDLRALLAADIIITTPEKWDGISRQWQTRSYVKKVCLMVIDEIHLLGADRGPILEVIVSRMRYISAQTDRNVRFVGLSTALANAQDLAGWLGVGPAGLFNFKPSVRPVPLECHIQGYPGKFYCPRMATMNKPSYAAIQVHSPTKPVLIFVSSRRQTRLTALDLVTYAAADERPRQWVRMDEEELELMLDMVKDASLRHTLQFGIGLHHAGLNEKDRQIVERLYVETKIQVLIATSTLAWGVNTPAHLVIIKGTEYYDAPTRRYADYPITDVLQMMGRAGRPQYDRHGVAVIMVHEPKKQFYKRFLYEPFPVESSLHDVVSDHFNAEVVAGTISSKQDAVDYLTWTYFYRRLLQNPSYYDLPDTDPETTSTYLSNLVEGALGDLEEAGCLEVGEEGDVTATAAGRIAAFYYLKHATIATFTKSIRAFLLPEELLEVLCSTAEYDELPVRHNEDRINVNMCPEVRYPPDTRTAEDPHTKANLLLQAHMARMPPPISDYATDTKGVLDNSLRLLQAMVDAAAGQAWLGTTLNTIALVQGIMQGRWPDDDSLIMLPNIEQEEADALAASGFGPLHKLLDALAPSSPQKAAAEALLKKLLGSGPAQECLQVCARLPVVSLSCKGMRFQQAKGGPSAAGGGGEEDVGPVEEEGWMLELEVSRIRGATRGNTPARVWAPRFPKVKEEGWFLVVGDQDNGELFALKRTSFGSQGLIRVKVPSRGSFGQEIQAVSVYLCPDSYLGLDHVLQVELPMEGSNQRRPHKGGASRVVGRASSLITPPTTFRPSVSSSKADGTDEGMDGDGFDGAEGRYHGEAALTKPRDNDEAEWEDEPSECG